MPRRRNILHAACNFAALLHEPGSIGDRWQVLSSCPNRGLLERVGHGRTVDLALVAASGPVVPLRIDKDELSLCRRREQRDELAAPHSITSSASASSLSGTFRPSRCPNASVHLRQCVQGASLRLVPSAAACALARAISPRYVLGQGNIHEQDARATGRQCADEGLRLWRLRGIAVAAV